jgi:ABC-2 type transport system permease protein
MSSVRLYLGGALAVARRDFLLFMSYRLRLISQIISSLFVVTLFYYVSRLVVVRAFPTHNAYFAYVIVGLAAMQALTTTVSSLPGALRGELLSGTFERMVVSPYGPLGGIVAMTLFPIVMATVMVTITMSFAIVLFGLPLDWATAPLVVPVVLLGWMSFLPLALMLAAAVLIVKQAGSLASFLISGLTLASGSFFPVTILPPAIRWISEVEPLTPALQLTRHVLVGAPITGSPWVAVAKLAGFGAVLFPLSLLAISTAIRVCRRRGTLIEY